MNSYELPLVFFTVFSQLSVGLIAVTSLQVFAIPDSGSDRIRSEWLVAAGALLFGMTASAFHLGHPAGMVRAITNLGSAWLSREALSTGLFLGLVLLGIVLMSRTVNRTLVAVTALTGILVLFCMGMTYSPPSFPAINNVLPFLFFLVTAGLLGASVYLPLAPTEARPLINSILAISLVVGLVIYLVVPCIWLSGSEVMRQTGQSWIASPLYWARIIAGLVLPVLIIGTMKKSPAWLWVIILAGELIGRAVFFANTVHTATNMGGFTEYMLFVTIQP